MARLDADQLSFDVARHAILATLNKRGGPYAPTVATLGNPPSADPDVALSAIFLILFFIAGGLHLVVLILNQNQGRLFVFSGLVFLFCLIRVVSCCLRIGWVYNADNISLTIAAQLLVNVGTAILFVTNNWFTQRVMRARHPHIGWSKPFDVFMTKITELLIISCVVTLITVGVHQFYTQNPTVEHTDHILMTVCLTIFAVLAFVPLPICVAMLAMKKRTYIDKFGTGRFRTKVTMLIISSFLLSLESSFRAGVLYLSPTPINDPHPWYLSDPAFYVFGLMIEIIIVTTYLILRVDQRFYVPEKAFGPGVYSGDVVNPEPPAHVEEITRLSMSQQSVHIAAQVASIMSASARNSMDYGSRPTTARRNSGFNRSEAPRRSLDVVPWPEKSSESLVGGLEEAVVVQAKPIHAHLRSFSHDNTQTRPTIKPITSTELKTRRSASKGRVSFSDDPGSITSPEEEYAPSPPERPNHRPISMPDGRGPLQLGLEQGFPPGLVSGPTPRSTQGPMQQKQQQRAPELMQQQRGHIQVPEQMQHQRGHIRVPEQMQQQRGPIQGPEQLQQQRGPIRVPEQMQQQRGHIRVPEQLQQQRGPIQGPEQMQQQRGPIQVPERVQQRGPGQSREVGTEGVPDRGRTPVAEQRPPQSRDRSVSQTRSLRPVYMYQHGFQVPGLATSGHMRRSTQQDMLEQVRKQRLRAEEEQQFLDFQEARRKKKQSRQSQPQPPRRPQPRPIQQPSPSEAAISFDDPVYDLPSTYTRRHG